MNQVVSLTKGYQKMESKEMRGKGMGRNEEKQGPYFGAREKNDPPK